MGYTDGYSLGHSDGVDIGYAQGCAKMKELARLQYLDGYESGHDYGYEKGYYLGYSSAVVDYADDATETTFVTQLLNTPSDNEEEMYHDLYNWTIRRRKELFGR